MKRWMPLFAPETGAMDAVIEANASDPAAADLSLPGRVNWDAPDGRPERADDVEALFAQLDRPAEEPEPAAAETAEEAKAAGEAAEAEPAAAALDLAPFRGLIPEAVIERPEDLVEAVRGLTQDREVLGRFEALAEGDEALLAYLSARQQGRSTREAAREAFADLASAPDPDVDPEAYAEWRAEQARQEERQRHEAARQTDEQRVRQRAAQEAEAAYAVFAERMKAEEGFDRTQFAQAFNTLLTGDPRTGRFRADAFDVVWKGMHYERDVQKARDDAYRGGKLAGMKEARAKATQLPEVPNPTGLASRQSPVSDDPAAQEMLDLARSTQTTHWWDKLPK